MFSQGHIQAKAADRDMIARAIAEFMSRNVKVEESPPAVSRPVKNERPGPGPILFGAKASNRKPKVSADRGGACRKKRDTYVPRVRELADKEMNASAIARDIGISRFTVSKIAQENGITLPDLRCRSQQDDVMQNGRARLVREGKENRAKLAPTIREISKTGLSLRKIAAAVGVSPGLVTRVANEYNITIKKTNEESEA